MNQQSHIVLNFLRSIPACINSIRVVPCKNGEDFKVRFSAMIKYRKLVDEDKIDWDFVCREINFQLREPHLNK